MPRLARRASTSGWKVVRSRAVRAGRAGSVMRWTARSKRSGSGAIASRVVTASGAGRGSAVTRAASRAGVSVASSDGSVRLQDAVVGEVLEQRGRAGTEGQVRAGSADHRDEHVLHLRRVDRQPEPAEAVEVL